MKQQQKKQIKKKQQTKKTKMKKQNKKITKIHKTKTKYHWYQEQMTTITTKHQKTKEQ